MGNFLGYFLGLWTHFDAGSIALEAIYTGIHFNWTLLSDVLGDFLSLLNCHPARGERGDPEALGGGREGVRRGLLRLHGRSEGHGEEQSDQAEDGE